MDQRSKRWMTGAIASVVAISLFLLIGLLVRGGDNGEAAGDCGEGEELVNGECVAADDSDDNGEQVNLSDEELSELAKLLTVSTISDDARCVVDNDEFNIVEFDIAALKGVPPREWSDALGTPVQASEPEPARDEIQDAVCEDPLLGVTYLKFVATIVRDELLERTGVDILVLNPWLEPFAVSDDKINTLAAGFVPLLDVDNPSDEQVRTALVKNQEWQKVAAYANTLLDRFEVTGIDARMSVVNYHLAIGGLVVGGLPAVEKNPNQEDLPALILSLTEKDQCVPLLVIGFNMGDKRPELFEPPVCEQPPTPPEGPPGTVPPPPTPPPTTTTTTVPGQPTTTTTVPDEPTTTTTIPTCGNKNRWEDANDNGRIDKGECVPNLPPSGTVPAPPTTPPTATTVQPAPTPPSTTTPDPTPPNVTIVDSTPPPNTYTPPGAVDGTTVPPPTVAPPATPPVTAPPGGGTTPTR